MTGDGHGSPKESYSGEENDDVEAAQQLDVGEW
jgi:hypothetical protein